MVLIVTFVILLACCRVAESLRRTQRTRPDRAHSPQVEPPEHAIMTSSGTLRGLTWSALDDVQLTRLLTDAARQTDTDQRALLPQNPEHFHTQETVGDDTK